MRVRVKVRFKFWVRVMLSVMVRVVSCLELAL